MTRTSGVAQLLRLALATTLLASVAGVAQAQGPGRVYEQVSPADKGGYPVADPRNGGLIMNAAAVDGGAVLFASFGSFAGSDHAQFTNYRAVRSDSGWVSRSTGAAPTGRPDFGRARGRTSWSVATADLRYGLILTDNEWDPRDANDPGPSPFDPPQARDLYLNGPDGSNTLMSLTSEDIASGHVDREGLALTPDAGTAVFATDQHIVPEDASRPDGAKGVYARDSTGTRLVSVLSAEQQASLCPQPLDGVRVGAPRSVAESTEDVVSDDGSRILFSALSPNAIFGCDAVQTRKLFMRVGGERTVEVSASRRSVPDDRMLFPGGATLIGASRDGSRVVFTSREALTDDAVPQDGQVYIYEFRLGSGPESDTLALLPGSGLNVVGVSDDGSRLFTWSVDGDLTLVEDGVATEIVELTATDLSQSFSDFVIGRDGASLLFRTGMGVSGFPAQDLEQLYLWREGKGVACVSCVGGSPAAGKVLIANGNGLSFHSETYVDGTPRSFANSLSDDGSRVMFDTRAALLPSDVNNRFDVYEWHDGSLSLISGGRSPQDSFSLGMSGDGRDAFFFTADSLASSDVDGGDLDLYDARIGGGFGDVADGGAATCEGDGCQGAPSAGRVVDVPGGLVGRGNVPSARRAGLTLAGLSVAQRQTLARTGRVALAVRVGRSGVVRVRATARIGGRSRIVSSVSRRAAAAGRVRLVLRLSGRARAALARTGRLGLRLSASADGAAPAVRTLTLTRPRTAAETRMGR